MYVVRNGILFILQSMNPLRPEVLPIVGTEWALPVRQRLYHSVPTWVDESAVYFVTVCCAQRGGNQLNQVETFAAMTAALEYYVISGRWWVEVFLAMPDHWHALISFPRDENMTDVLKDWKRYVAKRAGVKWQDGFFEHRLRTQESAEEKWHYIEQNPVRKDLCTRVEEWPWAWEAK